MITF
jgi:hypothetical protein